MKLMKIMIIIALIGCLVSCIIHDHYFQEKNMFNDIIDEMILDLNNWALEQAEESTDAYVAGDINVVSAESGLQFVTIVPQEKLVWKYSAEYSGNYYDSRVRHYQDTIDFSICGNCDCGEFFEIKKYCSTTELPVKYICDQCQKAFEFVLDDGLLVELADTVMDDEEIFNRKHYARYFRAN